MTVLRCTSLERNLLDLAADFASPQVFNVIRTAYDSKKNKKGNQQSQNRRKPSTNNKKNKNIGIVRKSFK
jgi:hypothetical protein